MFLPILWKTNLSCKEDKYLNTFVIHDQKFFFFWLAGCEVARKKEYFIRI